MYDLYKNPDDKHYADFAKRAANAAHKSMQDLYDAIDGDQHLELISPNLLASRSEEIAVSTAKATWLPIHLCREIVLIFSNLPEDDDKAEASFEEIFQLLYEYHAD